MAISQQEYELARLASAAAARSGGGGRTEVTSTLRDRTPQPQEKPLDEAEVIWGKPSNFSWGSGAKNVETGPTVQTSWNVQLPGGDDPLNPEDELQAITYDWTELSREEKVVRIDGPDGAYVDDARAVVSRFRLPNDPSGRPVFVNMTFLKFSN